MAECKKNGHSRRETYPGLAGIENKEISQTANDINDRMVNFKIGDTDTDLIDDTIKRTGPKLTRNRRTRSLYGVSPNCKFGPCGSIMENGTSLTIPDPGSQKLMWKKAPLSVLVIKKIFDEQAQYAFKQLVCWLIEEKNMVVFTESYVLKDGILATDPKFQEIKPLIKSLGSGEDDFTNKVDFVICLGGDGTLLHASSLFQKSMPPVMAFNLGSLGFLTPFSFDNFKEQVTYVIEGNASLLLRYRLKCVVCKKDSPCSNTPVKQLERSQSQVQNHALVFNEVVVDRGPAAYLCHVDLYIEHKLVTSVQGDGLIISTATGSTAYAVSAGASMVHPNVPAIVITPICPHSLSFRPIVVPAGVEIKIMVSPEARNSCWVCFDGRNRQELLHGECVKITTAQYPVPCVCSKDPMEDWFESLAECLHWNVRKPQKALTSSTVSSASITSLDSNDLSS